MLRFYFNIDYTELKDSEFIEKVQELIYMLNFEGKRVTTHGKLNLPQL